jgi:hypothetical protein
LRSVVATLQIAASESMMQISIYHIIHINEATILEDESICVIGLMEDCEYSMNVKITLLGTS